MPCVFGPAAQRAEIHKPGAERPAVRQERRPGARGGNITKPCKGATASILHQDCAFSELGTDDGPATQGVTLGCRMQALWA